MIRSLLIPLVCSISSLAADKPNVLFIICDDLNCDLGSYGHPQVKTPNIDKLAARGTLFSNAHCQYSLCGPSRASFMTSLYPDQTQIRGNNILIRKNTPKVVTMSQLFKNNGYTATRIGKIYHYNVPKAIGTNGHDDPASWSDVFNPIGRDKTEEKKIFTLKKGQYGATLSWLAAEGTDEEQTDGIAATEAVARLKKHAADKTPFFMAVGLYRPHTPFVAPKKYFDLYPVDQIEVPTVPEGYFQTIPKAAVKTLQTKKEQINLKPELARQAIQGYHASISFADAQIGRILDALEETGLAKNTIVVFTSDHGYHMGEHGHWQKRSLLDQGTRVPLIIAAPGQSKKGIKTNTPAEMLDIYPTVAALAGLTAPSYLQGINQAPVLDDPDATPRTSALTQLNVDDFSLRTERYRYTEWKQKDAKAIEFYDHQTDPKEMKNLAKDPNYKKQIAELAAMLEKRVKAAKQTPAGVK
ncbi:iduronate-2-sulfatase [Oceaniferula spumae]|uniref:Iduronate-2-sulfatase n=1 Tax=Oceaniferula spumae TaxID=2979115 RepID=A0AAT9FIE6_9BACT